MAIKKENSIQAQARMAREAAMLVRDKANNAAIIEFLLRGGKIITPNVYESKDFSDNYEEYQMKTSGMNERYQNSVQNEKLTIPRRVNIITAAVQDKTLYEKMNKTAEEIDIVSATGNKAKLYVLKGVPVNMIQWSERKGKNYTPSFSLSKAMTVGYENRKAGLDTRPFACTKEAIPAVEAAYNMYELDIAEKNRDIRRKNATLPKDQQEREIYKNNKPVVIEYGKDGVNFGYRLTKQLKGGFKPRTSNDPVNVYMLGTLVMSDEAIAAEKRKADKYGVNLVIPADIKYSNKQLIEAKEASDSTDFTSAKEKEGLSELGERAYLDNVRTTLDTMAGEEIRYAYLPDAAKDGKIEATDDLRSFCDLEEDAVKKKGLTVYREHFSVYEAKKDEHGNPMYDQNGKEIKEEKVRSSWYAGSPLDGVTIPDINTALENTRKQYMEKTDRVKSDDTAIKTLSYVNENTEKAFKDALVNETKALTPEKEQSVKEIIPEAVPEEEKERDTESQEREENGRVMVDF